MFGDGVFTFVLGFDYLHITCDACSAISDGSSDNLSGSGVSSQLR